MNILNRRARQKAKLHLGSRDSDSAAMNVEALEPRMMLSTVTIQAVGQEGGEIMKVYANNELIIDAEMTQQSQEFTGSLDASFDPDDVRIEFTNDLYDPGNNFDRNLIIESLEVDGQAIQFDNNMFSTGTYTNSTGIVDGFGRGNVLHTEGFFQYRPDVADVISFQGKQWQITGDRSRVINDEGELRLDGRSGPVSISTQFDVEGEALYQLSSEAHREAIGFFDPAGQPWSTIGVNFYDAKGRQLGQERYDVTGREQDPASTQSLEFTTPPTTDSAYVWAWIGNGPNVPLVINNIQFEAVDLSGDTTPPTAELQSFTLTEPTGIEVNFGVIVTDDIRRGDIAAEPFRVTGPNGFSELAGVRTGLPGSTETTQTLIYGLVKEDGSDWDPSDNGTYTVELLPGALTDRAGNEAAAGVLGTLEFAIVLPPVDTVAPEITLEPTADLTERTGDPYQFVVYTTDNRSPFPYARDITVVDPNGSEVNARGIAGGFDEANNRNWELHYVFAPEGGWTAADNGEYQIVLKAGQLIDIAGNEAPEQVLGSFVVNIGQVTG